MKKLLCLLLVLMFMLALSACGDGTCKQAGCDEKAIQDGYCATHYALHTAGDLVGGIISGDVTEDDLEDALGDALDGLGDLLG